METGKTLADFSAELKAINERLDSASLASIALSDHAARAECHETKAAAYEAKAALFEAAAAAPDVTEKVVMAAMFVASAYHAEQALKYREYAANARRRAGGGR